MIYINSSSKLFQEMGKLNKAVCKSIVSIVVVVIIVIIAVVVIVIIYLNDSSAKL